MFGGLGEKGEKTEAKKKSLDFCSRSWKIPHKMKSQTIEFADQTLVM